MQPQITFRTISATGTKWIVDFGIIENQGEQCHDTIGFASGCKLLSRFKDLKRVSKKHFPIEDENNNQKIWVIVQ